MHYYLVAVVILVHTAASKDQTHLLTKLDLLGFDEPSKVDLLDALAAEICGIAFTAKTPSVIVNVFGPIAYCEPPLIAYYPKKKQTDLTIDLAGRFLRGRPSREEVERQLAACKKTIGWPVDRLIDCLKNSWSTESRDSV